MRFKKLVFSDIRMQYKYGFYMLYLFFTIFYIAILLAMPASWRQKVAYLLIFTDPAAMGLYFLGAIVLFEKSERVLNSIAVSPVKTYEYVLSKLFSLAAISTIVGLAIGIAGGVIIRPIPFTLGLFLCSCLCSSLGLIVACKISTLNQFVIATLPAEIFISVPPLLWLFFYNRSWLIIHPGVCLMMLFYGDPPFFPLLILLLWTALFAEFACRTVNRMLKAVGGVKL